MKTVVFCGRVWIFANGPCVVNGRCAPIKATSEEPTYPRIFVHKCMVKLLWMMEEPKAGGTALLDKWRSSHPCPSVMLDIRWFDEHLPSYNGWIMLHAICRSRQSNGN